MVADGVARLAAVTTVAGQGATLGGGGAGGGGGRRLGGGLGIGDLVAGIDPVAIDINGVGEVWFLGVSKGGEGGGGGGGGGGRGGGEGQLMLLWNFCPQTLQTSWPVPSFLFSVQVTASSWLQNRQLNVV